MASLLGVLLELLRMLRSSVKDHIKRFPRSCWALLLAYLNRKLSEWWCSWPSKPGTHINPKPANPSFPGGRGGSCSVSCSSARHAARVAASTVPGSANAVNRSSRDGAESQPETPRSSSPPISATTRPVDHPPPVPSPDLNPRRRRVGERRPTNHSSGNVSIQSAGDRPSSRSSVQNDRSSRDWSPRGTHRQFGPGSSASRLRGRPSRSPSPQLSPQISTRLSSPSSHTREQLSPPAHPAKQRTTSIGWDVQNPSTESLPSINAQELAEALRLVTVEASTRSLSRISFADRSETSSQHSHMASSAQLNHFILPEGRILQLINSDQIPRYTKNTTT